MTLSSQPSPHTLVIGSIGEILLGFKAKWFCSSHGNVVVLSPRDVPDGPEPSAAVCRVLTLLLIAKLIVLTAEPITVYRYTAVNEMFGLNGSLKVNKKKFA